MKTLYLVRHAKSSWKDMTLADRNRPLNKRGKRDAPFMGKLMYEHGIFPEVLISSPALRALTTAKAFAKALNYPSERLLLNEQLYEASVYDLLEIVQQLEDNWQSVMLFGHNMTYTMFANWYANPPLDNVPTGAVVALQFDVEQWSSIRSNNGQLQFFEYPRKYFPKQH